MDYEILEASGEWIVRRDGRELARFTDQEGALKEVAARLRGAPGDAAAKLSMRYAPRTA